MEFPHLQFVVTVRRIQLDCLQFSALHADAAKGPAETGGAFLLAGAETWYRILNAIEWFRSPPPFPRAATAAL
jgi:hypothetical protein